MRRMIRTLLPCVMVAAACSHNPPTGPASLQSCTGPNGTNCTTTAKSAWIEPTHAGYMINGTATNYLGWLVQYTDATAGTECSDDLQPTTTIKIITTDVETSTHTETDLMPAQVPVVAQLPDTGITTEIAVVIVPSDVSAAFENGMISLTTTTATETDGSLDVFGGDSMNSSIELKGDFYAHKCFN